MTTTTNTLPMTRRDLDVVEDWAAAHTDPQVETRIGDLLEHIEALEDLIHAEDDPPRSKLRKAVGKLQRMVEYRQRRIEVLTTLSAEQGRDERTLSHDREELAATEIAVKVLGRLVEVDFNGGGG